MSEQQLDRHPWCRDVCRDEFVRAAEDGRRGRLPTLDEAIDAVWMHPRKVAPAANGHGGSNQSAPAASGWLTAEERDAVEFARAYYHAQTCGMNEDGGWYRLHKQRQLACDSLLARSSPLEVVLPKCEFTSLGNYEMGFLEAIGRVKQALAAAGVKVTEGNL